MSRETDAKVAEALGWKRAVQGGGSVPRWVHIPESQEKWHTLYIGAHSTPEFSTSRADAIVGLEATGTDFDLRKVTSGDGTVQYVVFMVGGGIGRGPTLPAAAAAAIIAWHAAKGGA